MAAKDSKDVKDNAPAKLFTRAEVLKHNKATDIWVIIHNKVYDVTKFLNEHPGGEEILLEQGGKDGTEPFEDIGHSTDARQIMDKYKIGELVENDRSKSETTGNKDWSKENTEDGSSASWRSWLIPIALGVLATLIYRYFISAH